MCCLPTCFLLLLHMYLLILTGYFGKKKPLNFNHDASRLIIVMCQHTANDCYKLITKSYENYSLIK